MNIYDSKKEMAISLFLTITLTLIPFVSIPTNAMTYSMEIEKALPENEDSTETEEPDEESEEEAEEESKEDSEDSPKYDVEQLEGITAFPMVTVGSEQELLDAIADTTVETIIISDTIDITATVLINRPLHLTGGELRVSNAVMKTPCINRQLYWHHILRVLGPIRQVQSFGLSQRL